MEKEKDFILIKDIGPCKYYAKQGKQFGGQKIYASSDICDARKYKTRTGAERACSRMLGHWKVSCIAEELKKIKRNKR